MRTALDRIIETVALLAIVAAMTLAINGMAQLFAYLDFRDCVDHIDAITDGNIAAQVYQCAAANGIDPTIIQEYLP